MEMTTAQYLEIQKHIGIIHVEVEHSENPNIEKIKHAYIEIDRILSNVFCETEVED